MDYKQKYLKYKQKYMLLKQLGGMREACTNLVKDVKKEVKIINLSIKVAKMYRTVKKDTLKPEEQINEKDITFMATLTACELDRIYEYVTNPTKMQETIKQKFQISEKIAGIAATFGEVRKPKVTTPKTPVVDRSIKPKEETPVAAAIEQTFNTTEKIATEIINSDEVSKAAADVEAILALPQPPENTAPEPELTSAEMKNIPEAINIKIQIVEENINKIQENPKSKKGFSIKKWLINNVVNPARTLFSIKK
jgi:hypothetical protein